MLGAQEKGAERPPLSCPAKHYAVAGSAFGLSLFLFG
jgi:hypothetical protein